MKPPPPQQTSQPEAAPSTSRQSSRDPLKTRPRGRDKYRNKGTLQPCGKNLPVPLRAGEKTHVSCVTHASCIHPILRAPPPPYHAYMHT